MSPLRPLADLSPEECAEAFTDAWEALVRALGPGLRALNEVLASPQFAAFITAAGAAHRAEMRRVHAAYRRRKRGSW